MTAFDDQVEQKKMPAIMEYKRSGRFVCYMTKIGYNKITDSDGTTRVVRAWQYHGKDLFPLRGSRWLLCPNQQAI